MTPNYVRRMSRIARPPIVTLGGDQRTLLQLTALT